MQDPWNGLNVTLNGLLAILLVMRLLQLNNALPLDPNTDDNAADPIKLALATCAVLVWIRNLGEWQDPEW